MGPGFPVLVIGFGALSFLSRSETLMMAVRGALLRTWASCVGSERSGVRGEAWR
jgi:hypothetical protein